MTDHYDRAVDAIQRLPSTLPADEVLMLAQVHATLHLAEQQRIANIIALAESGRTTVNGARAALAALYDGHPADGTAHMSLRPEITRTLRIETP